MTSTPTSPRALDTETPASVVALRNAGPFAKPRLRGVSHRVAFFLSPLLAIFLVVVAATPRAAVCAAVYGLSLIALFAVSGSYHRRAWSPRAREWLGRADHATIFLFIAGSYVPIGLLSVGGNLGAGLVAAVSVGAALGIAQTLFWPTAPRSLHVALYAAIGWPGALGIREERASLGYGPILLQGLGGLLYLVGAVIYSKRRPDPFPAVFGYHEVFHALVIAATGCFYATIYQCVTLGAINR